jgi:mycothiol synthase
MAPVRPAGRTRNNIVTDDLRSVTPGALGRLRVMSPVVREQLTDDEVAAALEVTEEAAKADGVRPLGESALLRLRDGRGAVLAYDGDTLAGVAILDGDTGELAVRPAFRRRGHGRALVEALAARAGTLNVWAHGELPAAVALADTLGFERFRALWQMRRPLGGPLPEYTVPAGVRLRTFEPGRDEDAWLRVNARAFAHHPEQGRWTRDDLERREREPWFSAEGFFLAEREGALAGFHWTKVHADGPIGEVYVVGVDPDAQGLGLGRVLTLAGLHHLRDLGLPAVLLYVDESNTAATGLYGSLDFERRSVDAMYRNSG